jgi:SAM-dependent methyltransferase
MHRLRYPLYLLLVLFFVSVSIVSAQTTQSTGQTTQPAQEEEYRPTPGQAGKDVVWVPTPEVLVEKMLDVAKVTPQDYVMDLGSGDGRNIIAAAKRGARALGVEYNPQMVALSKRLAAQQGVSDKATFVEGDMFEADISKATVMALFLLPQNMVRLRDKFFALTPGSRIVANTFGIEGWEPDEKITIGQDEDCSSWCTVLLWIVPAKVEGVWRLPEGELTLKQEYQKVSGTLSAGGNSMPIENGRLRGNEISFTVDSGRRQYAGVVKGEAMEGKAVSDANSTNWRATRAR